MLHIDLFSGIGGFALAADRVWPGIEHTFVEFDSFCQAILRKHYPNSIIHGDIRTFVSNYERPFILTAGVPCQPASVAGRRRGKEDDRWLWPQTFRVIELLRPEWVILENVRGLITLEQGVVFKELLTELENLHYETSQYIIPACAVGAPHRRDRIWIVAHRERGGCKEGGKRKGMEGLQKWRENNTGEASQSSSWNNDWREVALATCNDGMDDGLYKRLHSLIIECNENKQINGTETNTTAGGFTRESLRTLWEHRTSATPSSYLYQLGLCDTLPNVSCESRQERWYTQEQTAEEMRGLWKEFYSKSHEEEQDVQQRLLDRLGEIERNEAVVIKKDDKGVWCVWYRVYLPTTSTNNMLKELCKQTGVAKEEIEIISGARHRKERLKACGNAIVPQVAEQIMIAMRDCG